MLVINMYKNRVRYLREINNVTQKDVANYLNIEASHYGHLEIEYEIMPLKHLNNLCNYFNVSLDYIFEFTDIMQHEKNNKEIDKLEAGKRLKEFRKINKLTQVKLASILKTVHSVITNYENGKNLISTAFLYTICSKYNISADYLVAKINKFPAK